MKNIKFAFEIRQIKKQNQKKKKNIYPKDKKLIRKIKTTYPKGKNNIQRQNLSERLKMSERQNTSERQLIRKIKIKK